MEVRILEIEWVADNVTDFYKYLGSVDDDMVFANELIKVLLEQQNYTG